MIRFLVGLLVILIVCLSTLCFGNDKAAGESQSLSVQDQTNETKEYETKYGPFTIWGKSVIVVNNADIINSFEIKNESGLSYYKEPNLKGVSGLDGVQKIEGKSGEGLIFFFYTSPSAPNSGISFQIFGMDKGKVKPLSLPISVYGELQPLQEGKSQGTVRLIEGDLIKIEQRADLINVVVPLVIDLQKLKIAPLRTRGVFDINIGGTPNAPGTENQSAIKFYKDHNINSKVKMINYEDAKKIEFINAFAEIQLKNSGYTLVTKESKASQNG